MKKFLGSLVAIAIILAAGWYFLKDESPAPQEKPAKTQKPSANTNQTGTQPEQKPQLDTDKNITGTLMLSDKSAYGNLMLAVDTDQAPAGTPKKIYIFATRGDYSAMLGKKVMVKFKSGSALEFTLESITALEE